MDVRTAFEAETAAYQTAQRLAKQGAALARQAGLEADGLAVADDVTVADTLVRLARELDGQAGAGRLPKVDLTRSPLWHDLWSSTRECREL